MTVGFLNTGPNFGREVTQHTTYILECAYRSLYSPTITILNE